MTKYLVCLTHGDIGRALLEAAELTLGRLPIQTTLLSISHNTQCDTLAFELEHIVLQLQKHHEILILTDLYGSTPHNIAQKISLKQLPIISGLNLPMLLKIMNYNQEPMDVLIEKATKGGQEGITANLC